MVSVFLLCEVSEVVMDLEFISAYTPMYMEAAVLTIRIALYGIAGVQPHKGIKDTGTEKYCSNVY